MYNRKKNPPQKCANYSYATKNYMTKSSKVYRGVARTN